MSYRPVRNPAGSWPLAAVGVALAVLGAALLIGLFVVLYGEAAPLRSLALQLGLAGTTLVSAVGQLTFLAGLAMIWRARRRRRG